MPAVTVTQYDDILLHMKSRHHPTYHNRSKFQLRFFFPYIISKRDCKVIYPTMIPYQLTQHKSNKTVPIQVTETVMDYIINSFDIFSSLLPNFNSIVSSIENNYVICYCIIWLSYKTISFMYFCLQFY